MAEEIKKCSSGSVGIIFEKDGKMLMFRRLSPPPGWAGIAGHLDGDDPLTAAIKESREEVGLEVKDAKLLFGPETIYPAPCGRDRAGYNMHEWSVYQAVEWKGEPANSEPDKHADLGWLTRDEIKEKFTHEPCDPAWRYIFAKLGII